MTPPPVNQTTVYVKIEQKEKTEGVIEPLQPVVVSGVLWDDKDTHGDDIIQTALKTRTRDQETHRMCVFVSNRRKNTCI